nr:hypothetical protein [Tanacetum cinerariifolium]
MVALGAENIIARRVSDDLIAFSGKTLIPRYMRFFLDQNITKSRWFVMRMHEEAETDAKRGEESKLLALNDVIAEALDDFDILEMNVKILGSVFEGYVQLGRCMDGIMVYE